MTSTNYLVITFDGGGIRGLITALLLQDLEKSCQVLERTNLLAGTSTGGIIALGLAANVPPQSIVNLYQNDGATIFDPYQPQLLSLREQLISQVAASQGSIFSIQELFSVKYNNTGLQSVLNSTFPRIPKLS